MNEITYAINTSNNEQGEYYSVTDDEGYPINHGHFSNIEDAQYVAAEMNTGKYIGDYVSLLCKSMDSWIAQ